MTSHRRGPWSQAEDAYLCQLVHTQGALNWVRIAQLIGSRSPKQCRERYHQNLKPSLNHEPISHEEGLQIEKMVGEMGKRWAEIARRLHGRSDNAVKNWWNGSMNRRNRMMIRRSGSGREGEYIPRLDFYPHHHQRAQYQDHEHISHQPCSQYHRQSYSSHPPVSYPRLPTEYVPQPYHHHQYHERQLISPATSELSHESMDHAPSLMSDNGSLYSVSPRGASSPNMEISSHVDSRSDARRLSIHSSRPAAILSPIDEYATSMHAAHRHPNVYTRSREEYRPSGAPRSFQTFSSHPSFPGQYYNESLPHNRDDMNLIQLPPLKPYPSSPSPQDNRMHLSSLLG